MPIKTEEILFERRRGRIEWMEFAWAAFYMWVISKGDAKYLNLMRDEHFLKNLKRNPNICKDEDVQKKIITEFLNTWGGCRIQKGAAQPIKRKILSLQSDLKVLDKLKIKDVEFTSTIENAVENCYNRIQRIKNLGPTATSKLLHVLVPELFVMWDTEILKYYGRNPKISDSGKGYCIFLKEMKSMANEIKVSFREAKLPLAKPKQTPAEYLSERMKYNHEKTLAKYLDEYNWIKYTYLKETYLAQVPPAWHPQIKQETLSELLSVAKP